MGNAPQSMMALAKAARSNNLVKSIAGRGRGSGDAPNIAAKAGSMAL